MSGKKVQKDFIDIVISKLLIGIMAVVLITTWMAVFWRYVLNDPLRWTEELARLLYIWLVYMGFILLTKEQTNLRVDFFVKILPPKVQIIIKVVTDLLCAYLLFFILQHSQPILRTSGTIPLPALRLPTNVFYYSAVVSFVLVIIFLLKNSYVTIRDGFSPKKGGEGI